MYGERDERIATHLCKRLLMYARAIRRIGARWSESRLVAASDSTGLIVLVQAEPAMTALADRRRLTPRGVYNG
jgi:hypothetical protein